MVKAMIYYHLVNVVSHVLYLFRYMNVCTFVYKPGKIYPPLPAVKVVCMFSLYRCVTNYITDFVSKSGCGIEGFNLKLLL